MNVKQDVITRSVSVDRRYKGVLNVLNDKLLTMRYHRYHVKAGFTHPVGFHNIIVSGIDQIFNFSVGDGFFRVFKKFG